MPRVAPVQTNFTVGEMSPKLDGRVDITNYANGVTTLENMTTFPQGGATRRFGTRYVAEVKTSANKTRLIPFQFNTTQAYIIELGNLYMRFYMNGGQILSGGSPYEIATPWTTAQIFDVRFSQTADIMYLTHSSHKVRKLSRTGHTAWTLSEVEFTDGPYLDKNITATTVTPSATTGTITLTASAALFESTHVGAPWRITHGATTGWVKITAFTSSTQVTAEVKKALGGTTATADWYEGAFSDKRGYPAAVTLFEERLWLGGTTYQPQTIWGSYAGSYEDMTPGSNASDAVNYTIGSRQANIIRWLEPSNKLIIGTAEAEFSAGAPNGEAVTPTNVRIRPETNHGVAALQPVQVGNSILFLQRAKKKLREMLYRPESDDYAAGYIARDVTLLSEHISGSGFSDLSYQQEPDTIVWCVRSDGQLAGLTFDKYNDIVSWHRHTTDGSFESVATIPTETSNQVWFIVNRTINGATKRYVEYVDDTQWTGSTKFQWIGLNTDSALTYSGSATTSITGLGHLEGKTVKVIANGATHPDKTVSGGAITLDRSSTEVEIGLGYNSKLVTARPEAGGGNGTAQGKRKRWSQVIVRLYKSLGVKINGDQVPFRASSDAMGAAPALTSEDVSVMNLGYDRDGRITIEQTQPLPLTVLLITGILNTGEG